MENVEIVIYADAPIFEDSKFSYKDLAYRPWYIVSDKENIPLNLLKERLSMKLFWLINAEKAKRIKVQYADNIIIRSIEATAKTDRIDWICDHIIKHWKYDRAAYHLLPR